jgi:hypothetical protein
VALDTQVWSDLYTYYTDKYDSAELVEHLGICVDELLVLLEDWILENPESIEEDLEYLTNFKDGDYD